MTHACICAVTCSLSYQWLPVSCCTHLSVSDDHCSLLRQLVLVIGHVCQQQCCMHLLSLSSIALQGLSNPFLAARYHSLVIAKDSVPDVLEVTAWTEDGTIMAVQHKQHPQIQVHNHYHCNDMLLCTCISHIIDYLWADAQAALAESDCCCRVCSFILRASSQTMAGRLSKTSLILWDKHEVCHITEPMSLMCQCKLSEATCLQHSDMSMALCQVGRWIPGHTNY